MSRRTVFSRLRALLLLAPILLLTGCSKVSGLGFEEGVTSVNDQSLSLWQGAWIAGGVVGVITLILILWPAIFHRGKKDDPSFPKQTQYNVPVEVAYTVIPFIIVAVLFYYTAQTLVVPLGERVRYTLTANDVVHGFWIPAFMIQMQNLPGVTNHLEFTANKLGEFPGRCNILCGRNHTQMLFTVKVVTPAEYDAYLETLKGGQA